VGLALRPDLGEEAGPPGASITAISAQHVRGVTKPARRIEGLRVGPSVQDESHWSRRRAPRAPRKTTPCHPWRPVTERFHREKRM
jgi:hypothetical protein